MNRLLLCAILLFGMVGCSLEERYGVSVPTLAVTNAVTATPTFTLPYPYSVTTDLTKRSCPSVSCAEVGYYHEGDVVLVDSWLLDETLEECQLWAHISNQDHWVCGDYLFKLPFVPDEVYSPTESGK